MTETPRRMPAVFVGHGSPTNALARNHATDTWQALGKSLPRPRAILVVSAHWYTRGTYTTANARPETIHDFGGFPKPLYEIRYDAPGDPALSSKVVGMLAPMAARESAEWGLDHGAWSVLLHMYPKADIPVVQLSIDGTQRPAFHYAVGQRLASLRDDGVLILGSGGIVHNLALADWAGTRPPPAWAVQFDQTVRERVTAADDSALVEFEQFGDAARLSVPTPEHYLPLLYVLGARRPGDTARIAVDGFELSTISMTAVVIDPA